MSSQTAAAKAPITESPIAIPVNSPRESIHDRARGRIAERAYELYKQCGSRHGEHISHWLRAEAEIFERVQEIRESSSWYTINVPMKGVSASDILVSIDSRSALIAAEKRESRKADVPAGAQLPPPTAFTCAKWPAEVDPATGSAYIKNEVLTLSVKRSFTAAEPDIKRAAEKSTTL